MLPTITASIRWPNENYQMIDGSQYHTRKLQAEVLILNLNSGTMRVRAANKGEFGTTDIDIEEFFEQYELVKKDML